MPNRLTRRQSDWPVEPAPHGVMWTAAESKGDVTIKPSSQNLAPELRRRQPEKPGRARNPPADGYGWATLLPTGPSSGDDSFGGDIREAHLGGHRQP